MPQQQLSFPPVRVPIGQFTDAQGKTQAVLMTPEFARSLATLLVRVGGPSSLTLGDALELTASTGSESAQVSALQLQVLDLSMQLAAAHTATAHVASLERRVEELAQFVSGGVAGRVSAIERQMEELAQLAQGPASTAPVDWGRPGKIGASTANSGKFTTLETTAKTQLNPVGADVELKPTGAGKVVVSPGTAGTIDNMAIGGTTAAAAKVTTLTTTDNATIGAASAGAALAKVSFFPGYSTTPQYRQLINHAGSGILGIGSDGVGAMIFGSASAADGTVASIWASLANGDLKVANGFGCNGKAAQAPAASGGTLAGVIAALVANGILSS